MATTAQRLAEYEELYRKAQQYNPNQYKQEFEKAYGEATNYNKDLIEQQARALGELQAVAPTYRERYMNSLITDPTAQMALIAQARQAPITSYSQAANLLTARGQRYQDILNKALSGYQTAAEQANIAAENAWRLYQDSVQQDQFNRSQKTSSGGSNLASILQALGIGKTGVTTQEISPQQKVLNAINSIKQLRQTRNIEPYMNQYFQEIMNQAGSLGLRLNPEGLWQQLGNTTSKPMTYNLFM